MKKTFLITWLAVLTLEGLNARSGPFFDSDWWLILGQGPESKTLHGLTLEVGQVDLTDSGPHGLKAWNFLGDPTSYIRIPNPRGGQLEFNISFTIGVFVYHSASGSLVEWRSNDNARPFATHFWHWGDNLFTSLGHLDGTRTLHNLFWAAKASDWKFVGMSFNQVTGKILLWLGNQTLVMDAGQVVPDCTGDVYIGNRGSDHSVEPLTGALAGLTIMRGAIEKGDIERFKCNIIALGSKRPFFGRNWWNALSQLDANPLSGLDITTHRVELSNDGPLGLMSWHFKGKVNSYVKVTTPKNGPLHFKKSFAVGTFIRQAKIRNGPIIEWRSNVTSRPFATHFWYWGNASFTSLSFMDGTRYTYTAFSMTPNQWHFVGMAYDFDEGKLRMWLDGDSVFEREVGQATPDCTGDVYIGVRGSNIGFNPFKGDLAGLTFIDGAINENQVEDFKCMIVSYVG